MKTQNTYWISTHVYEHENIEAETLRDGSKSLKIGNLNIFFNSDDQIKKIISELKAVLK